MILREIQSILVALQRRAYGLTLLLSVTINALLLGSLLYVTLPQYDQTFNERQMMQRIELLSHTISIDVVNVWKVNLFNNTRKYVGSHVLQDSDQPIVAKFVEGIGDKSFTTTLAPEISLSLMNGNSTCQNVYGEKTPNPITQKFREEIKARQICWVPIISKQGHLIGYVTFIWKEMISQEELASFLSRSIGLVNHY